MGSFVLTAADAFGLGNGYYYGAVGSISAEPFTTTLLYVFISSPTPGSSFITLLGDQSSSGPLSLIVDGVEWEVLPGVPDGGGDTTSYPFNPVGDGFVAGNSYNIIMEFGEYIPPPGPTIVGVGAVSSGTGIINPGLPSGLEAGDWMYLNLSTANQAINVIQSGWEELPGTAGIGTAGAATALRHTIFRKVYEPGDTAPSTTDSGSYQIGVIVGIRNVGSEHDLAIGSFVRDFSPFVMPVVTTTVSDCLILCLLASDRDIQSTNTQLANIDTPRFDYGLNTRLYDESTSAGQGGGVFAFYGMRTDPGTLDNCTFTLNGSSNLYWRRAVTIALAPPATTPPVETEKLTRTSTWL